MHDIVTSAHNLVVAIRQDGRHTREVFVDDDLECSSSPPITSIEMMDQPPGMPATVSGTTIVCHEIGLHLFRVGFGDGSAAGLRVISCERGCMDRLPNELVLRALVNHAPGFDGSADSILTLGNLAQYGG